MSHSRMFPAVLVVLALVCAVDVGAQVQSVAQQKCLNGLNGALAKLAKTQQKEIAGCLKAASTGKLPVGQTAEQCLTADGKGKIGKATAKIAATATKLCGTPPDFGFAGAAAVNAAGVDETLDLEAALFGGDLGAAAITVATDKAGAGCQAQVTKSAGQLLDAGLAIFRLCKQAGLKDGSIASALALDACLDAVTADAKGKITKLAGNLGKTLAKKCEGVTLASAFPGGCAAAPDFGACVALHARCETCQMLTAGDALGRDCDVFDDGLPNSSCGASCVDADGDGYGASCAAGPDCNDAAAAVHPGAIEVCNGVDDDCDGDTDGDAVDVGVACDEPLPPPPGATSPCAAGATVCTGGVLSCDGALYPTGVDICGVDNNCDGALTGQPDLQSDVANCGSCGHNCLAGSVHAGFVCNAGTCQPTGCQQGYYDLDANGSCEYACFKTADTESCNGVDDDCDGLVDEGVIVPPTSAVCGTSPLATTPECTTAVTRTCTFGSWVCTFPTGTCSPSCAAAVDTCGSPTTTGVDNDCNGFVDDDTSCQACSSIPESCNGCDDDCDGTADESAPAVPCGLPAPAPANCQGISTCSPPQAVPPGTCTVGGYGACSYSPIAEFCDGLDNDCDGVADDNIPPAQCDPIGTPPGRNYGGNSQCKHGQTTCSSGTVLCQGYVGPTSEICDGIDNDCDNLVDEGAYGVGETCGIGTGSCSPGTTACVGGTLVCQGGVGPQPEICDGLDNDCDGHVDDSCIP